MMNLYVSKSMDWFISSAPYANPCRIFGEVYRRMDDALYEKLHAYMQHKARTDNATLDDVIRFMDVQNAIRFCEERNKACDTQPSS